MRARGVTLVEVLVVVVVVAILAAILFPVIVNAKMSANKSACISNLRQIGSAFSQYMADYDDRWPLGLDPADKWTPEIWQNYPEFQAMIPYLPLMPDLLNPYLPSTGVWRCPSDRGYVIDEVSFLPLDAEPSSFERFGSSYYYRTEVTVRRLYSTSIPDLTSVNIYFDGSGAWHSKSDVLRPWDDYETVREKLRSYRYTVLFGDWHVKSLTDAQYREAWAAEF